jgi:hypothetical protein
MNDDIDTYYNYSAMLVGLPIVLIRFNHWVFVHIFTGQLFVLAVYYYLLNELADSNHCCSGSYNNGN